jgi:hypothetical protein
MDRYRHSLPCRAPSSREAHGLKSPLLAQPRNPAGQGAQCSRTGCGLRPRNAAGRVIYRKPRSARPETPKIRHSLYRAKIRRRHKPDARHASQRLCARRTWDRAQIRRRHGPETKGWIRCTRSRPRMRGLRECVEGGLNVTPAGGQRQGLLRRRRRRRRGAHRRERERERREERLLRRRRGAHDAHARTRASMYTRARTQASLDTRLDTRPAPPPPTHASLDTASTLAQHHHPRHTPASTPPRHSPSTTTLDTRQPRHSPRHSPSATTPDTRQPRHSQRRGAGCVCGFPDDGGYGGPPWHVRV